MLDAVDEFGDDLAEDRGDLGFRGRGILDHIVQDGGDQGVGVELEIGEDVGHGDRMRDVGLARHALLALMPFRAEIVRFAHALDLRGREIALELI